MSLVGFKAKNHPQQVDKRGAVGDIDDRETIADVFVPLDVRFGFTLDVAAASHNTKCERFFDRSIDGLAPSWAGARVWCNPPYSDLRPWVEKAWFEYDRAEVIVMLLPANRTEQTWWQELVEPYRDRDGSPLALEFMPGRLRFLKPGQGAIRANERPPFGCCLLIWRPERAGSGFHSPPHNARLFAPEEPPQFDGYPATGGES